VQTRRVKKDGPYYRVLQNFGSTRGEAPCRAFPLDVFEQAILSCLEEIDPHEILNGDAGPDESLLLSKEHAAVEAELAEIAAFMGANGFSATLGKRALDLEERKRQLAADLAEARPRAVHSLSESWGEFQSLAAALASATDQRDARLRLCSALRRIVESIHLLVVPRGRDRLCAVQVRFTPGERHRDYLIVHRAPRGNKHVHQEGSWQTWSLADVEALGALDLRERDHAEALERKLLDLDLADLDKVK